MMRPEELNFIDRLHHTMEIIGKKKNRSYRFVFGISILMIFLSLGIIEPGNELSIEWINIKINISILLIILSFGLTITLMSCYSLIIEVSKLSDFIREIYESFDLKIKGLKTEDYDYLEYPDFPIMTLNEKILKGNKLGKILLFAGSMIFFIGIWLLPLAAHILCFIKLIDVFEIIWWLILIYSFLAIINVILVIMMIRFLN